MATGERRIEPRRMPKQARGELTRDRILDAAAHVFADYGYAAGTTNRIAAQARISIGSLYQYFPNKDAILAELVIRHLGGEGSGDEAARVDELMAMSLQDALRSVVGETISNHRSDPHLLQVMIEHTPLSGGVREKVRQYERQRLAQIRRLVEDHREVRVDDPEMAARLMVYSIELVTHQLMADPEPVDAGRLEDALVAMLHGYLAARP